MLLNLSDVFTSEGKVENKSVSLEMTSFDSRLGSFLIREKSPVEFTLTNIGVQKARIEGSVRLELVGICDRCLTETPIVLELKFDRTVVSPEIITEDEDADDMSFMEGYQLNVETFVYNEILVNWPVKILCKDDCKGVCPVCGQNLNLRECGCDTFVPDPRMAVIKDIFLRNKEV
ncbi:MAG: YceD family protein [Acetatifactor sp.]